MQVSIHSSMRFKILHCVKNVQIRTFFWSVFSCIWTEYGPEETPYLDTFYTVLDKLFKEQKLVFLPEDFNTNLLNYNDHNTINEFLLILKLTIITDHSKAFIVNTFSIAIF